MPPCCCRFQLTLLALVLLLAGAGLVTWHWTPATAKPQQCQQQVPQEVDEFRTDAQPLPACEPAKPERVTSEDSLPVKIRPIKGSLLSGDMEPFQPGENSHPAMI